MTRTNVMALCVLNLQSRHRTRIDSRNLFPSTDCLKHKMLNKKNYETTKYILMSPICPCQGSKNSASKCKTLRKVKFKAFKTCQLYNIQGQSSPNSAKSYFLYEIHSFEKVTLITDVIFKDAEKLPHHKCLCSRNVFV